MKHNSAKKTSTITISENKPIRVVSILFLLLFVLMSFSACGEENHQETDKDGNIKKYTINEILSSKKYGFYIKQWNKKGYDEFIPLMTDGMGLGEDTDNTFSGDSNGEQGQTPSIKWCDYKRPKDGVWINHKKLTPKVTKDTPLVAIFESEEDMPEEYQLSKYEYMGYTIGANVILGSDKHSMYLSTEDGLVENSSMASVLEEEKANDPLLKIGAINDDSDNLPYDNIDTDISMLVMPGIRNQYIKMTFFKGTLARSYSVKADTEVLKHVATTTLLSTSVKETNNGYFEIEIPSNLESDMWYSLNGLGLFRT